MNDTEDTADRDRPHRANFFSGRTSDLDFSRTAGQSSLIAVFNPFRALICNSLPVSIIIKNHHFIVCMSMHVSSYFS